MAVCSVSLVNHEQCLYMLELHRIPPGVNHDGLQEMTYMTEGKDQNDIVVRRHGCIKAVRMGYIYTRGVFG